MRRGVLTPFLNNRYKMLSLTLRNQLRFRVSQKCACPYDDPSSTMAVILPTLTQNTVVINGGQPPAGGLLHFHSSRSCGPRGAYPLLLIASQTERSFASLT